MLGQRARPVRRAGMGKPTPERVHGVPSPTQHIPFEAEAANLFFQLISNRYERASVIVTSNKPFGRWGEVFGDETVAAAMIDRLVHHAEVHSLKGDSYRMRGRNLGRVPAPTNDD
jgi:IstB-like ATP binding protein